MGANMKPNFQSHSLKRTSYSMHIQCLENCYLCFRVFRVFVYFKQVWTSDKVVSDRQQANEVHLRLLQLTKEFPG